MGKYTFSAILIVIGSVLLLYGYTKESVGGVFDPKRASMNVGGILLAIGGIMAVVKSTQK